MTTAIKVLFEKSDHSWREVTSDVKHISISQLGLVGQRYAYPTTGKCLLTMNNISGNYSPALTGIGTGYVDNRRRVQVRYSGANHGAIMKVGLTGTGGTHGPNNTGTSTSSTTNVTASTWWAIPFRTASFPGKIASVSYSEPDAPTGSGTATWELRSNTYDGFGNNVPGALLDTGTFSPAIGSPSISPSATIITDTTSVYWFIFKASGTLVFDYKVTSETPSAPLHRKQSLDGGATWIDFATTDPTGFLTVTTTGTSGTITQLKSNTANAGQVYVFQFDGRAPFDSQFNTLNVKISDTSGVIQNTTSITLTNKWKTYTPSFTVPSGPLTTVKVTLTPTFTSTGLDTQQPEMRNMSLKLDGGADLLTPISTTSVSAWTANTGTNSTPSISAGQDYTIVYNGFVENIQPTQGLYSALESAVTCVDWTEILKMKNINVGLQQNQTADQLMTTVLNTFTPVDANTFYLALPGKLMDTGKNVIDRAFDTYTQSPVNNNSQGASVLEACTDAAISEYGRIYVDRDGTFRFRNRDFWVTINQTTSVVLALPDGKPWAASDGQPRRGIDTITNSMILTYHPRTVGGSVQPLGNAASAGPLMVPAADKNGNPGQLQVTLTYHDATGRVIGGQNQLDPVATTDYMVNDSGSFTGFDYTSTGRITFANVVHAASQSTMTLKNSAIGPLFVQPLQVRGNPITIYDPVQLKYSDATSIATYQERTYTKDLPFANDQMFIASLMNFVVTTYKYPYLEYGGVKVASKDTLLDGASNTVELLSLELFDVVSVVDSQNGVNSAMKHFVIGANYELDPTNYNAVQSVEFILERFNFVSNYMILDHATYGQLDNNVMYI